ncbi:MAG: acyltransferase family protein [Muribaculum sp.]|nr:acyltransferase family protein [Muribaculum sp.]
MNNSPKTNRERVVWPDLLKCFAIFLVILGHIVATYDSRGYSAPVNKWIYSFHMPLFMMLSGLFFKYSLSKPFKTLLKGKSVQLIVPLFAWSIVGLIIEQLMLTDFNNLGGGNSKLYQIRRTTSWILVS